MNANIRYWQSLERDALTELDAAKTTTALKLAGRHLMLARLRLAQLTSKTAEAGA